MFSNNDWAQHRLRHRGCHPHGPGCSLASAGCSGGQGERQGLDLHPEWDFGGLVAKAAGAADFSRLRPLRRAAISSGSAAQGRAGKNPTNRTCHSPPSCPLCHLHLSSFPSFPARFHREFQPLTAVITTPPDSLPSLAGAGSLGASSTPAAPDPQSRGTTGTAATMVVPADRQTDINTHTHTREQSQAAVEGVLYGQELD